MVGRRGFARGRDKTRSMTEKNMTLLRTFKFIGVICTVCALSGVAYSQESAGPAAAESAPAVAASAAQSSSPSSVVEVEWEYIKTLAENKDDEVASAALGQLSDWLRFYPEEASSAEAQLLKARLHLRAGEYKVAVVDLLKHLYVYPQADSGPAAAKLLKDTIEKKAPKKIKQALVEIAFGPAESNVEQRLALLIERLSAKTGEELYEPVTAEFAEFFGRFPRYAGRDALQLALADYHLKKEEYLLARLGYEKMIQLYPLSPLRVKGEKALGDVLAVNIKDYAAAIKVYQAVAASFPGTVEAWASYLQLAVLCEKQKQYPLALSVYERIIGLYPDRAEAYEAFRSEARILRSEVASPKEAMVVLSRLADKYPGEKAVEALYLAAEIARNDIKDFEAEIKMYDRVVAEYPDKERAPRALLAAGQAYEKLKNRDKAKQYYTTIIEKFPDEPLAKKAQKYIVSLDSK